MLRREGRRRLRTDVLADMPLRGEVTVSGVGIHGMTATLERPDMPGKAARTLLNCRMTALRGQSLVLGGVEELPDALGGMRHRQAWWCRLPAGTVPRPADPDPPSHVHRRPSYSR